MRGNFFTGLVVIVIAGCFLLACKSSKTTESKYVGKWHYTFDMEGTEYAAVMTINRIDEGYSGSLSSDLGSVDLNDLVIEEDKLTANFDIQGYVMDLEGTFNGDIFSGKTSIQGYEFPMEAIRKQE